MSAPYVIPHVWKSFLKRSFCLVLLCMIAVSGIILAKESEVVVRNGADKISLGGTLARPDSVAPKGAVLLLSGSGSQNRDEEVFGHRPFKVLSDYLVSRGYAVLRTDDRGVGGSEGDPAQVMAADLISDARSCVSFLDSCFGGKVPVGVIGHSEGGQTAYRLASENVPCRFIVTLAAPSWEGDSIIISQCRAMSMAMSGAWPGEALQKRLMAIAKSDMPAEEAGPVIRDAMGEVMGEMMKYPQVQEQIERQIEVLLSPSYREMLRYNPEEDIRKVCVPWLALNGSKDLQVIPANLLTIKSQNPAVEVCELENHNHLFQQTSSGLVTEYARLGQSPSEETLCRIADWLDGVIKN